MTGVGEAGTKRRQSAYSAVGTALRAVTRSGRLALLAGNDNLTLPREFLRLF
jgi:hypothetical protein